MRREKKRHSICAICGGNTFLKHESLGLLIASKLFILHNVKIAECETCGERYHPLETVKRIHAEIDKVVKLHRINKKDVKKLNYVHEPQLAMNKNIIEESIFSRLDALENTVKRLTDNLALVNLRESVCK